MLIHNAYSNPSANTMIRSSVGNKFSLLKRWRLGGTGSQKLQVKSASKRIINMLEPEAGEHTCNIEIRQGGIMVHFKNDAHCHIFAVPWHYLNVFRSGTTWNVFGQNNHVRLEARGNTKLDREFFYKMIDFKAKWSEDHPTLRM